MSEPNDDSKFRERFDLAATYLGLAILALVAAAGIVAVINGLYH